LPRAATQPLRRRAWLRIFVVRCGLPCDPPFGGHSCNGQMIPRFHRAVSAKTALPKTASGAKSERFDASISSRFTPRSRPMRGHPSTVSSFQFGKYRTKSSSTSGHPAVGVAFHSRVQATAEVPSRLNDQQTCYRRASQFSRIIFAIVCVEHRERQP
jgi:hypothetical protein